MNITRKNLPRHQANHSHSLEKQADRRATPWRMLDHPWMVEMKGKRVNMVQFLKTVWDWQD